ncbi:MAG: hypothetical protein JWN94_314 [Betaproteobacteria bacterium]|nr:hypothetical protein [Betaproteobacteria bacterium]
MIGKLITNLLARSRRRPKQPAGNATSSALPDVDRIQLAFTLERAGKFADAEQIYRALLLDAPENVDLLHLLGNALRSRGQVAEAIDLLQRAVARAPSDAVLLCHLADAFAAQGNSAFAVAHYRRAVKVDAELSSAAVGLAYALRKNGDFQAAATAFRRALELRPDMAELHSGLAGALRELGELEVALESCMRAIELQPVSVDAYVALGYTLRDLGRSQQSIDAYRRAVELRPDLAETHLHLGNALFVDGYDLVEAAHELTRAIELKPDFTDARFNLALTRLARGDYSAWPDYELRKLNSEWPRRGNELAQWSGEPLNGKRLLVHAEQGLGDEIMFASCIADATAAGARCMVECSPKLETLFQRSFPQATVYAANDAREVPASVLAAGVELECAIGSLPVFFRKSRAEFPMHAGYLIADAQRAASWRSRFAELGAGLKIGISWQGGKPNSLQRRMRSMPLVDWLPILQTAGTHFVDLQYTACAAELADAHLQCGVTVHSWNEVRTDYEHTAAVIAALDLVISVDTAVVHLAGALGRPVWVMAPYGCEWRYGIAGEEMPWYPSLRIFRQPAFGEWGAVIGNVRRALDEMTRNCATLSSRRTDVTATQ